LENTKAQASSLWNKILVEKQMVDLDMAKARAQQLGPRPLSLSLALW
jgi:hypothetical protein